MSLLLARTSLHLAASTLLLIGACQRNAPKPDTSTKRVAAPQERAQSKLSAEEQRQRTRAESVEILRDDFGVPHIYGKSDADAVFGLLYAHAEDDFPRIERNYIWATGRLAEVDGEKALYSDLRAHLYMTPDEAKAEYEKAPPWLKELCVAFADGLNFYLATHPDHKPKLISHFEPWMPMYFFEGSIGGDIEQIPLGGIEAFYGPDEPRPAPRSMPKKQTGDGEPRGSNGFALAGSRTKSGKAMLLINPHTSFYFRGEAHMVSDEGLNAYGAVTWGQFFIYQGFNEHNGWMHTSTHADFIDEFVEDIFEEDGKLRYAYGDETRDVEVGSVTLAYRQENGSMGERTFPTYRTHHGPITHMSGDRWVVTRINWEPARALEQSYVRTKTDGHASFQKMMDIRTNSSNNTVYADAGGNIAYYHGNFMPRRDPAFDYAKAVDGSNPKTDWNGLHTVNETVHLFNPPNGWLQNCNSTPFTAALEHSPKRSDYPAYMAPDDENFRGVHATRILADQEDLTLDTLIELAYEPTLPAFELLIPGVLKAFDKKGGEPNLAAAITLLRAWDHKTGADSKAMTIAHFYGMEVLRRVDSQQGSRLQKVTRFAKGDASEQLAALSTAVAKIETDFGKPDPEWGEVNRLQRLDGEIDLQFDDSKASLPIGLASGRWGALASFGAATGENTKKIYGRSGNSFVAVVEFGDRVQAKTLLAGGQSNDPASPHFFDQGERYQKAQFKDVAYYREDVESRARRRYRPGD